MSNISSVAVIGLGYIGLPTAAILADHGLRVHGVDVNPDTVAAINDGSVPFVEPELGDYVARTVAAGQLTASTETPAADAYIVAVPTPVLADKAPELTYIESAGRTLAAKVCGHEVIILECTSPPGA